MAFTPCLDAYDKTFREVKTVVYRDILFSDVKESLYESLQALNVEVSRRLKKCELIDILDELFTEKPFYIIDRFPKEEQILT